MMSLWTWVGHFGRQMKLLSGGRLQQMAEQHQQLAEQLEQLQGRTKQQGRAIRALEEAVEPLMRLHFQEDTWLAQNQDLHRGERCFLIGCGPSLNEVDLSRLNGSTVMGVNGTYLIEELTLTYFASVSHRFWIHHEEGLRAMRGPRRFLPFHLAALQSDCPTSWFNFVDRRNCTHADMPYPAGFTHEPHKYVFGGGTVIYICLQILFYLGFHEVVLLGIDHDYGIDPKSMGEQGRRLKSDDLNAHFREDYYQAGHDVHIDLHAMERGYAMARDQFEAAGRRIINATPGTKLDIFEKVSFDTVLSAAAKGPETCL